MNIKVRGGQVLSGEITPSGSKNSAVALIPASILFKEKVIFENIPDITDVAKLVAVLTKLGSKIVWNKKKNILQIDNSEISFENINKEDLGNMKGISLLWGPMLARFGKVAFKDLPGGCTLGFRTLDPHLSAFKSLGVKINEGKCGIEMNAKNAGSETIWLPETSPTATENIIMLATGLSGTTKIIGAASEPQVQDLCNFLIKCGAEITGVGSSVLEIKGGHKLHAVRHRLLSDHYEIATFLALGALTGGRIRVKDALPDLLIPIISVFKKFGIEVKYDGNTALVEAKQKIILRDPDKRGTLIVRAQPWPGLPVDTLPLFIPLALKANGGQVLFHNWMYEAGLFWSSELQKMGANIVMCDPHRILVASGKPLHGAVLEAPYIIRAVVALLMAALVAEGESIILNGDALYRGHPNFSDNLKKLGALVEELS